RRARRGSDEEGSYPQFPLLRVDPRRRCDDNASTEPTVARRGNRLPREKGDLRLGVRIPDPEIPIRSPDVGTASEVFEELVELPPGEDGLHQDSPDRKSTRLNSSHVKNSYAVYCL